MSNRFMPALGAAVILALISACPGSAQQPPALPFSPYGTVTLNGAPVPDGTVVSAWCGGVPYRLTSTMAVSEESWYFNLDIPGDDPETQDVKEGCSPNQIVNFKIGDSWAGAKMQWMPGGSGRVDLAGFSGVNVLRWTWLPLMRR